MGALLKWPKTFEGWFALYAIYALSVPFWAPDVATTWTLALGPITLCVLAYLAAACWMGIVAAVMCLAGRR